MLRAKAHPQQIKRLQTDLGRVLEHPDPARLIMRGRPDGSCCEDPQEAHRGLDPA